MIPLFPSSKNPFCTPGRPSGPVNHHQYIFPESLLLGIQLTGQALCFLVFYTSSWLQSPVSSVTLCVTHWTPHLFYDPLLKMLYSWVFNKNWLTTDEVHIIMILYLFKWVFLDSLIRFSPSSLALSHEHLFFLLLIFCFH